MTYEAVVLSPRYLAVSKVERQRAYASVRTSLPWRARLARWRIRLEEFAASRGIALAKPLQFLDCSLLLFDPLFLFLFDCFRPFFMKQFLLIVNLIANIQSDQTLQEEGEEGEGPNETCNHVCRVVTSRMQSRPGVGALGAVVRVIQGVRLRLDELQMFLANALVGLCQKS